MTPEELKYYKALQSLFKEKMGAVQYGDVYLIEVLPGEWRREGQGQTDGLGDYHTTLRRAREGYNILFIPLTIDTENPERGLWGMVDWNKWILIVLKTGETRMIRRGKFAVDIVEATPALAILKALAAQEGVKVDE